MIIIKFRIYTESTNTQVQVQIKVSSFSSDLSFLQKQELKWQSRKDSQTFILVGILPTIGVYDARDYPFDVSQSGK